MKSVKPARSPSPQSEQQTPPARTHDTMVLAGCMIHTPIDTAGMSWLSQALHCVPDLEDPPAGTFNNLHMTMQVSTFDDIDTCTRIATKTLGLSSIASIGMRELLVNAVEHGNLGITFDEKSELLQSGRWQEEIERRLISPQYRDKYATVSIRRDDTCFTVIIQDQGDGFDWGGYLESRDRPGTMLHGRGMSLAMSAEFAAFQYSGTGSEVFVSGKCDRT